MTAYKKDYLPKIVSNVFALVFLRGGHWNDDAVDTGIFSLNLDWDKDCAEADTTFRCAKY